MYLLYVDESGDIGDVGKSPTRFFALSGLVIHELRWHDALEHVIGSRRLLRQRYGLKLREEVHARDLVHAPGKFMRIPRHRRLLILRDVLDCVAQTPDASVMNVVVDKRDKAPGYDVFQNAWRSLVQRFENTIRYKNFPGPQNVEERGVIFVDQTDEKKLRELVRRMRRYNPVPSRIGQGHRMMPLETIIEDPVHRNSAHAYFIQLADVAAYFLYQKFAPNKYLRRKGAAGYFDRLDPALCKVASASDPQGIVRL